MGTTRFTGPLVSGDTFDTFTELGTQGGTSVTFNKDTGFCVLTQNVTLQAASATTATGTVWLPQFSQILDFSILNVATWSGATTFLTVGTPTNATAYLASTVINTAAPAKVIATSFGTATFDISTTQPVVLAVQQVTAGGATGNAIISILYAQTDRTS